VRDSAAGKFKFACVHTEVLTCLYTHSYLCMFMCKGKQSFHPAEYFRPVSKIEIYLGYPRHVFSIWLLFVILHLILFSNSMEGYCQIFIDLQLPYGVSHLAYIMVINSNSLCNKTLSLTSKYCIN
jgi:hypothetical protein